MIGVKEKRQCVTLSLAAGVFLIGNMAGGRPWGEAQMVAQELRVEQARMAVEAAATMGEPEEMVAPVEHEAIESTSRFGDGQPRTRLPVAGNVPSSVTTGCEGGGPESRLQGWLDGRERH